VLVRYEGQQTLRCRQALGTPWKPSYLSRILFLAVQQNSASLPDGRSRLPVRTSEARTNPWTVLYLRWLAFAFGYTTSPNPWLPSEARMASLTYVLVHP